MNNNKIKEVIKEKYGQIAVQSTQGCSCGCGPTIDYSIMSDDYSKLEGYVPEADLGLGCGIPTEFADIKEGDTVLDLGSGAGNDVFVARRIVGESGKVIGVDMTDAMLQKARANQNKLGYKNVEFLFGEIENLPLQDNIIDVVISNCVLNLVPDKQKAYDEIYRVTKKGGHFCISDIVLNGILPESLKEAAEMYAGCVSGAMQKQDYIDTIKKSGFNNIQIKKAKTIELPESILKKFLTENEMKEYKLSSIGIESITVIGWK
jgi:arsenite methyltransferase